MSRGRTVIRNNKKQFFNSYLTFLKEISFWCIVLFLVIAMVIHHILSDKSLIEGQQNSKINMKDVSKIQIKMSGSPEFMKEILSKKKVPQGSEENIVNNENSS